MTNDRGDSDSYSLVNREIKFKALLGDIELSVSAFELIDRDCKLIYDYQMMPAFVGSTTMIEPSIRNSKLRHDCLLANRRND